MAIEYTLVIQGKELTNQLLLSELQKMGLVCHKPKKLKRGIEINQFQDILGLTIYLSDSGNPPYDALNFEFLDKEFKYGKCLRFRFDKDFDNTDIQWKSMIAIIFSVMNTLRTNAIFAYEFDTLYCFFSRVHELFINNKSEIWNNQYFRESTAGWNCFDIEKSVVDF